MTVPCLTRQVHWLVGEVTHQATMSTTLQRNRADRTESESRDFELLATTPELVNWLDEQPNFITVERTYTPPQRGERESLSTRRGEKTVTESMWLHPDYEIDTRACHGSQAEVCDAWEAMKFPKHNFGTVDDVRGAHLYSWSSTTAPRMRGGWLRRGDVDRSGDSTINYEAVQHPDGHGCIMHYSTLAAVRTKTGMVLVNEQDFGTGFAYVTRPDEFDHEVPLSGISNVLSGQPETVYDIERIRRDQTRIRYTTKEDPIGGHSVVTGVKEAYDNDRQVQRVELTTGAEVVLLYDSTAQDPDETKCGFYLPPKEAELYDGAEGALDALQPIDVIQAKERGMDIVPADEYAGNGAHGWFDDGILGEAVIRQGEWYLIPMDEDFSPRAPVYKPLPTANRENDWDLSNIVVPGADDLVDLDQVSGLPTACPDCGAGGLEIDADLPFVSCQDCDFGAVYDDAEYERLVEERRDEWVEDKFSEDYKDALDTLDSHRPRDLAVYEGVTLVRGTFRHQRNEHNMVNLKERWHLVAENTRDVTVFDLGTDDTTGVARWE
jgi:hypothetical protein